MKKTVRHSAVEILNTVALRQAFAGDLLDETLEEQRLSSTADGRLLTHLVYGVLRQQGHLDGILRQFYRGDYAAMEDAVKNILRVGLYQLKFSDRIPPFAVVDESVKVAKRISPRAGGLINAVLRNYLRGIDKVVFPALLANPVLHISTMYSHPAWLVKKWLEVFGADETIALCRTNNELPPLTLRANTLKITRDALLQVLRDDGCVCEPTQFSPDGIHLIDASGPVRKTSFFEKGFVRLQDEAAQLISHLVDLQPGSRVLDVCAGSGGKTTHLAALLKNEGRMVALDWDEEKLALLQKDARRLGATGIETIRADLMAPLPETLTDGFDRVVVDAPCSGTGTLRRNPEIKWRLMEGDIPELTRTQNRILHCAACAVRPGGWLIYCTCSVLPAENEAVLRQFLRDHPQFVSEKPSTAIPAVLTDSRGLFRSYPHRHGMDGFFGAVMRRRN